MEQDGDAEVVAERDAADSNMLVMPGKRKAKAPRKEQCNTKVSKNMQRKLKKIQEDREKREMRMQAYETLEKHRLSDDVHALISSSSTLGKAETMREKLRRAMQLKRAGLSVPSDIPLLKEKLLAMEDVLDELENGGQALAKQPEFGTSRRQKGLELQSLEISNHDKSVEDSATVRVAARKRRKGDTTEKHNKKTRKQEDASEANNLLSLEKSDEDNKMVPKVEDFTANQGDEVPVRCSTKETDLKETGVSLRNHVADSKFVVHVWRSEEVEKQRSDLPIVMMEQEIMEALHENHVVIICGETGCGKTTQVPQFLFEAGYGSVTCKDRSGMIGVTQPRRIAVLTTAKRVAHELNLQLGREVGFQVRHDRKIGELSCIKFMTDGILLREIQADFLLRKYSVIVLDEAHERSVNTDILIGMLSRVVPLRKKLYDEHCKQEQGTERVTPLKLVIMSATLRVEDFTANRRMFPNPPPVIHVSARQFPVTVHSSRKTELRDYESAAYRKVSAIHKKLPPGGILVFVTGRREVETLCRRLRSTFSSTSRKSVLKSSTKGSSEDVKHRDQKILLCGREFGSLDMDTLTSAVDVNEDDGLAHQYSDDEDDEEDENGHLVESESSSGVSDIEEESSEQPADNPSAMSAGNKENDPKAERKPGPLLVLPLYAMLPAAVQLQVFAGAPEGKRLVVVATNVAETSVTIPGIRYVVDCGRAKERKFCGSSGVSKFEVSWISKASADQRAGRAGRIGPGHCYQLYSRTHYHNNFPDYSPPEISLIPIEGVVLVLKCMGIDKVMNFPFPTPPEKTALIDAEKCLTALSALDRNTSLPTPVGRAMALYPINPRHARMVIAALRSATLEGGKSRRSLIVACAVAMAAALSVENPFVRDEGLEQDGADNAKSTSEGNGELKYTGARAAYAKFFNTSSDALTVVNALSAYEQSTNPAEFCRANHLNEKIMKEMVKLRSQLSRLVCQQLSTEVEPVTLADSEDIWKQFPGTKLNTHEERVLLHALCAGWPDRIARRITSREKLNSQKTTRRGIRYQASSVEEIVYLGPSSSTFRFASDFVVYKEIVQTSRPYMSCVSSVNAQCLVSEASYFCTFSKPLEDPAPWYDNVADKVMCWVSPTFGPHLWQLPLHSFPFKAGKRRTAVFACALLEGRVLPSFALLRPYLAADPSMLLKPEASVHKRVGDLLLGLEAGLVDSRRKLAQVWESNSVFLYREIQAWLQTKHKEQLKNIWEAARSESSLTGKELFGKRKRKSETTESIKYYQTIG